MSHLVSDISLMGAEAPPAAAASTVKPTSKETQTTFDQLFLESSLLIRTPKTGLDLPPAAQDWATASTDEALDSDALGGGALISEASTTNNGAFFEMVPPPLVPMPFQSTSEPWVRVPISTELNVITQISPESPTSDSALVDFARSQGFDEEAIALIFATPQKTDTTKHNPISTACSA